MYEYKDEIISSRVGNLGASDANIIARVAQSNNVPKSALPRLAVAKGLIEPQERFKTEAMQLGDEIEMAIYKHLKSLDDRWESNKLIKSEKFSKSDLSLIAHIDFFLQDNETKTIRAIECKATKESTADTRRNYRNQLYVELALVKEYAESLKGTWKVNLSLCHYCTANHNGEFDPHNITTERVNFKGVPFDLNNGMTILNEYVANMDSYYPDDEVDAELLPVQVKEQFTLVATILTEIKEREQKVEEFKTKLYDFLQQHNIKSIKNDVFTITRVDPQEIISFDSKAFLADYATKHPNLHKKLLKTFEKRTQRKGFAKITIK